MKPGNLEETENCRRVSAILSRIGDKWTVLVVRELHNGPRRFSEIRRSLGSISQKMLTTTLRALERDGFVSRTSYATIPPRVDYALTDLGAEALKAFEAFEAFAARHWNRVLEARQLFDARDADQLAPPVLRISTGR